MASGGIKKLRDLTPDERYKMQRLARHQMRCKLLADIQVDMTVCQLEGWDQMEYIRDLQELLNSFTNK